MSAIQNQPQQNDEEKQLRTYMIVAYILLFITPLSFVGAILTYIKRAEAKDTIYFNHAQFILRTFWGGALAFLLSFVVIPVLGVAAIPASVGLAAYSGPSSFGLMTIVIGAFTLFSFVVWLWYLVRVIFGLIKVIDHKTVKEKTWLI